MSKIKIVIGYLIGRFFFDFKGKHTFLKILNDPHRYKNIFEGKKFEVAYHGLKYQGIFSNFIDWGVFFQEGFEKGLIKFFFDEIDKKKFDYFIDIGANSGSISLPFSKNVKIICFEPLKYNFEKLKNNFKINPNLRNYKLFNFGASNINEKKNIYYSDKDSNVGTASIVRFYKKNNKIEKIILKKIDSILSFKNKNLLIKIDVEGYENKVFAGMEKLLRYNKVCVYIETKNKKLIAKIKKHYTVLYPKFWYSKYFFTKKKLNDDLIFKNYV